ncbi:MAG: DNA mismatch repair protein MutS, partial [Pseudomonadota bacterium]
MPDTAAPAKTASKGPSPFLAQYLELKARHKDALLFFRMGDFYELFFEDAADAAEILGITLTARGEYQGAPIPMAGVPFHAAEGYLARLIRAGRRVAVCEQTESPADAKKRGSKSVVNREIVRVVTPGTLTEDSLLSEKSAQALIAVAFSKGGAESAVAACDVSTGAFDLFETAPEHLSERLSALPARELLFVDVDLDRPLVKAALEQISAPVTTRPASAARPQSGEALLKQIYNVAALDAFGEFSRCELAACALLLDYVQLTQAGAEIRLDPPLRGAPSNGLAIDPATRASLEIDTGSGGGRQGSLLATIDRTLTGPGARLLASRLSRPSTDAPEIKSRYDAIGFFKDDGDQRDDLRGTLSGAPDLERARSRLRLGRGGPRDLLAIAKALNAGETAAARLAGAIGPPPALIEMSARALTLTNAPDLAALAQDLKAAVDDEPPLLARDGGFIRAGWDAALDEARGLQRDSRKIIAELQARYGQITGVSTLKIKHNNVLGYFIEVPARAAEP